MDVPFESPEQTGGLRPIEGGGGKGSPGVRRLWDRTLDRYPESGPRYWYLAIVVLAAIVLYYEFYVPRR